jgi:hypothetical protein
VQSAEIGGFELLDTGTRYYPLRALVDVPLRLDGAPLVLAHAGLLDAIVHRGRVEWTVTDRPAWFVGDSKNLWLVRWRREAIRLPYRVDGGVSVSMTFSRSPFAAVSN